MAGRDLNVGWDASSMDAEHPFEFVGNAKDYFGIWIVNVLLSIVTCLLYTSPSPRDGLLSRMPSSA